MQLVSLAEPLARSSASVASTVWADIGSAIADIVATLSAIGFNLGEQRYSLLTLLQFVGIVVLLYFGAKLLMTIIRRLLRSSRRLDGTRRLLVEKISGIVVFVIFALVAVDMVGIDLTSLAVFSGALGLAIGFGMQKTLGNLIAGIILLMDRSIKPGDIIVVGDSFGKVNKIGVRAVSIITRDGKEHLIPNENLMTQEVENWSFSSRNVRIRIPVGVSYESDIERAQELMLEATQNIERILASPPPSVRLDSYGDSSVNLMILVWIIDPEAGVGNIRSEYLNRLWKMFKAENISIPFPQRDLHIRSFPPTPS